MTATLNAKFGVQEVADVTLIDLITMKPVLFMDSLMLSSIDNKATTKYATGGKGGTRLLGWDFDRQATVKIQDALMRPEGIAMLAGTALDADATTGATVVKREVLKFDATGTLTLSFNPAATQQVGLTNLASPLISVYINDSGDGYTQDSEITWAGNAGTASATEYTVTNGVAPAGATVTTAAANASKTAIVYYQYTSSNGHQTVSLTSQDFPGYYQMVGDTVVRNLVTGQDEPYQIIIPKAKLMPNFSINLSSDGNPATFEFDLEVFKPASSTTMIQLIKY